MRNLQSKILALLPILLLCLSLNGQNDRVISSGGAGDNWGIQSIQSSPWFNGNGTVTLPLDLAPNGALNGNSIEFDGTDWVVSKKVLSLPDYTALKANTKNVDVILITHLQYGGIFAKTLTGTRNGGTIIEASNGDLWQRIWNGKYIMPDWWEVGSYSPEGTGVVQTDADKLNAASVVAGPGGHIEMIGSNVYIIDRRVNILPDQYWNGNGCWLLRIDGISSSLSSPVSVGATSIQVNDGSIFRIGHVIVVATGPDHLSGSGQQQTIITNITGNTLTLDVGLPASYPTGATVFVACDLMQHVAFADVGNAVIENINFDGNYKNNQFNHEWTINRSIVATSAQQGFTIRNCYFKNVPSENIVMGYGTIRDCGADSLGGSFVHRSTATALEDSTKYLVLDNCKGNVFCFLGTAVTGHSEGVVVTSEYVNNLQINNCNFSNSAEALVGFMSNTSNRLTISGGHHKNMKEILRWTATSATNRNFLRIAKANFEDCGDIYIRGGPIESGLAIKYININEANFVNGRLYMRDVECVNISDSKFINDTNSSNWSGWKTRISPVNAYITFQEFSQVTFVNNQVVADSIFNDTISHAALFNLPSQPAAQFTADYYYGNSVKINNNTFAQFKYGLSPSNSGFHDSWTRSTVGWEWNNNTVLVSQDPSAGFGWGMYVPPGTLARNNYIISTRSDASVFPIYCAGAHDDGSGIHNRILGAKVIDNEVAGETPNSIVITSSVGGRSKHSAYVARNLIQKAIQDNSAGSSYVPTDPATDPNANIFINSSVLPSYTSPQNPVFSF